MPRQLLYIWGLVLLANAIGAIGLVLTVVFSGQATLHEGSVARAAIAIDATKAAEPFVSAFFKGVHPWLTRRRSAGNPLSVSQNRIGSIDPACLLECW